MNFLHYTTRRYAAMDDKVTENLSCYPTGIYNLESALLLQLKTATGD